MIVAQLRWLLPCSCVSRLVPESRHWVLCFPFYSTREIPIQITLYNKYGPQLCKQIITKQFRVKSSHCNCIVSSSIVNKSYIQRQCSFFSPSFSFAIHDLYMWSRCICRYTKCKIFSQSAVCQRYDVIHWIAIHYEIQVRFMNNNLLIHNIIVERWKFWKTKHESWTFFLSSYSCHVAYDFKQKIMNEHKTIIKKKPEPTTNKKYIVW
jgi:hypothetical protein